MVWDKKINKVRLIRKLIERILKKILSISCFYMPSKHKNEGEL